MRVDGAGQTTGMVPGADAAADRKAKQAGQDFEALLIGQMMRAAREACESEEEDKAGGSLKELAEGQFAKVMAARGGFGLAQLAEQGVKAGKK